MKPAGDATVYSAAPFLRSPRDFAATAAAEMRVVPLAGWRMFVRNLQSEYRQSRLGYAWLLGVPLVTTLTWVYLANAHIVRLGDTHQPYVLYVLGGILLWQVFMEGLTTPLERVSKARDVLKKSRLPHETYLVAGALEVLFGFVVRLVLLVPVLVWVGAPLRWQMLLAPFAVLTLLVLGIAIGLLVAPAGLLYEDIGRALRIVAGLWFFLTPVVYAKPPAAAAWLIDLNPVTPVLTTARAWLIGEPGASPAAAAIVLAGALVLLLLAWLTYRLARPHLVARF
jgi:lipopolysaccharide transport system permease protein